MMSKEFVKDISLKKGMCLVFAIIFLFGTLLQNGITVNAAAKPKLNKTSLTLEVGSSETLTVKNKIAKSKYTWKSSAESIATVKGGKVVAKKVGNTTISCVVKAPSKTYTLKCKITVKKPSVTGVALDSAKTLKVGDSVTLEATVKPSNAGNKNITWTSNNTTVATVENGKVIAKAVGTADIQVKTVDKGKTAICKVTVQPVTVTGVTLNESKITLKVDETKQLTATVVPSNAGNKNMTWSSSKTDVATVSNGKITAKAVGTADITVKTNDGGKTAVCKVTVNPVPVIGVNLDKESISLKVYEEYELKAAVTPSNASNKNIFWKSSDVSVAKVDSAGKVEAVGQGEAIITVTTEDGGKAAECKVISSAVPVTDVSISGSNTEMGIGDERQLTAMIEPANATNKNVSWASSNNNVVTVTQQGTVMAVGFGEAAVTVTTEDGTKTAEWTLKVTGALGISSINVTSLKTIVVRFNQSPSSSVASSNFTLRNSVGNPVTVSAIRKISEVTHEYELTVSDLTANAQYTLTAKNISLNDKTQDDMVQTFTVPEIGSLYKAVINIDAGVNNTLKADSGTVAEVTFEVIDQNENRVTTLSGETVGFSAQIGSFAVTEVNISAGVATISYNSKTISKATQDTIIGTIKGGSFAGLKAECNVMLDPTPNLSAGDDSMGAIMTDIIAETADRVIIYFNREINVSEFQIGGTKQPNPETIEITVGDDVGYNGTKIEDAKKKYTPKAIQAYEGSKHAIVAILDVDDSTEYLKDNSKYAVRVVDKSKSLEVTSEMTAVFSDTTAPVMRGVKQNGLTKFVIEFSEPIINVGKEDSNYTFSGINPANWTIQGSGLNASSITSILGTNPTITVGTYNAITGEDARNNVTITCGTTANGKQFYLTAGWYSIQGSNIGDWAYMSDPRTKIETKSEAIRVSDDAVKPTLKSFEVQSPEQYVVTFNIIVDEEDVKKSIGLQRYVNGYYEDITKSFDDLGILVNNVPDESGNVSNTYIIETTQDWTVAYDTSNTWKNYFQDKFRLFIAAGELTNNANGCTNNDIVVPISEGNVEFDTNNTAKIMTEPDNTSPEIVPDSFREVEPGKKYTVIMTKPVKVGAERENNPTPSQSHGITVPNPMASFTAQDGTQKVISATVTCDDPYGKRLTIIPNTYLTKGNWKLSIASVSDDIGNTSQTLTYEANGIEGVPITVTSDFKVEWALASQRPFNAKAEESSSYHYVFIKFSEPIGDISVATNVKNYTLNSGALPSGSSIEAGIDGYADGKIDGDIYGITIKLPNNTFVNSPRDYSNLITISTNVKSKQGAILPQAQYVLPYGEIPE